MDFNLIDWCVNQNISKLYLYRNVYLHNCFIHKSLTYNRLMYTRNGFAIRLFGFSIFVSTDYRNFIAILNTLWIIILFSLRFSPIHKLISTIRIDRHKYRYLYKYTKSHHQQKFVLKFQRKILRKKRFLNLNCRFKITFVKF